LALFYCPQHVKVSKEANRKGEKGKKGEILKQYLMIEPRYNHNI